MQARRRLDLGRAGNALLAALIGLLVAAGWLLRGSFGAILGLLSDWVAIIVAFALLLGLANVLRVHGGRVLRLGAGWPYSLTLVASALIVLVLGVFEGSPGALATSWIFRWIYTPIGASLFALLAFLVLSAALRTLRAGPSAAWVLLAVALVVVIGAAPWSQVPPLDPLARLQEWIITVPALAGQRGLLLGAALGAIATSLRILLGYDRPYLKDES